MAKFQSLFSCLTLLFAASAYAGIGPKTDLTISNAEIAPDGYTRAAIVVNGVFPAPLITGKKVSGVYAFYSPKISTNMPDILFNRETASISMSSTK